MSDEEFLAAFERCSLTRADWTHAAHVRVGWLYLSTGAAFDTVMDTVREGTSRFNRTVLDKPDGYHETITHGFLHLIRARLQSSLPDDGFAAFWKMNPELFCSSAAPRSTMAKPCSILHERGKNSCARSGTAA